MAGLFAAMLAMRTPDAPEPVFVETPKSTPTVDVLVANGELPLGQTLKPADMRWQAWPVEYVPTGSITRAEAPTALDEMTGALVRTAFVQGEPMRREKVIKPNGSGFMAAVLPSGMRAVAISIDTRGASSAGGFILPNDRVDIVRIIRDEEAAKSGSANAQISETVLTNIKVLAIGQNIQERNGERVVTGETATLEVSPVQAETLALSQKIGQLSLSLRSLADAGKVEEVREEAGGAVTVIGYGVARQSGKR